MGLFDGMPFDFNGDGEVDPCEAYLGFRIIQEMDESSRADSDENEEE